jgi:hypothetical protein
MQSLEELQANSGVEPLRLLRMAKTRWNSAYLVMRRVAELAPFIPMATAMNKKRQNVDFELLPHAVALLAPIYETTQRLQADGVTIQHCFLEIKDMVAGLNANTSPLQDGARTLALLISERFQYYYSGVNFDPVYMIACALEPDYLRYMDDKEKRMAKGVIIQEV